MKEYLNTYYADTDSDGFGDAGTTIQACDPPLDMYQVIQIAMIPIIQFIRVHQKCVMDWIITVMVTLMKEF